MITKRDRIKFGLYMTSYRLGMVPNQGKMNDLIRVMEYCLNQVDSRLIENFLSDLDILDTEENYAGKEC